MFASRHHRGIVIAVLRSVLMSLLFGQVFLPGFGHAAITLDGTMGPSGPVAGPNYAIGADLGQTRGNNLFHSFGAFNVLTNESATFSGPNGIANVIGRVTGGSQSSIDGLLRSTIDGANLYLLNPSGILFGPNARLDVKGSFHASTADYLRFSDGGVFYADPAKTSVLSVASPEAFGFLNSNPAGISIQGSALQVPTGNTLSIVGGNIDITGNPSYYELFAPSGRVNVASVASPGEVIFNASNQSPNLATGSFERLGNIANVSGGDISTDGLTGRTEEPYISELDN